jgi:hypothetical protein
MKKFLVNKVFEYQEVIEILSEYLSQVPNLQEFCNEHGLQYNTILLIKNNYSKHYPKAAAKLLEIFGYKVETFTAFRFVIEKQVNESIS